MTTEQSLETVINEHMEVLTKTRMPGVEVEMQDE